jgi:hypothetical protein
MGRLFTAGVVDLATVVRLFAYMCGPLVLDSVLDSYGLRPAPGEPGLSPEVADLVRVVVELKRPQRPGDRIGCVTPGRADRKLGGRPQGDRLRRARPGPRDATGAPRFHRGPPAPVGHTARGRGSGPHAPATRTWLAREPDGPPEPAFRPGPDVLPERNHEAGREDRSDRAA